MSTNSAGGDAPADADAAAAAAAEVARLRKENAELKAAAAAGGGGGLQGQAATRQRPTTLVVHAQKALEEQFGEHYTALFKKWQTSTASSPTESPSFQKVAEWHAALLMDKRAAEEKETKRMYREWKAQRLCSFKVFGPSVVLLRDSAFEMNEEGKFVCEGPGTIWQDRNQGPGPRAADGSYNPIGFHGAHHIEDPKQHLLDWMNKVQTHNPRRVAGTPTQLWTQQAAYKKNHPGEEPDLDTIYKWALETDVKGGEGWTTKGSRPPEMSGHESGKEFLDNKDTDDYWVGRIMRRILHANSKANAAATDEWYTGRYMTAYANGSDRSPSHFYPETVDMKEPPQGHKDAASRQTKRALGECIFLKDDTVFHVLCTDENQTDDVFEEIDKTLAGADALNAKLAFRSSIAPVPQVEHVEKYQKYFGTKQKDFVKVRAWICTLEKEWDKDSMALKAMTPAARLKRSIFAAMREERPVPGSLGQPAAVHCINGWISKESLVTSNPTQLMTAMQELQKEMEKVKPDLSKAVCDSKESIQAALGKDFFKIGTAAAATGLNAFVPGTGAALAAAVDVGFAAYEMNRYHTAYTEMKDEAQKLLDAQKTADVAKAIANTASAPSSDDINLISGVSGALPNVDYNIGLQQGTYEDRANPKPAEIQAVIDSVNQDTGNGALAAAAAAAANDWEMYKFCMAAFTNGAGDSLAALTDIKTGGNPASAVGATVKVGMAVVGAMTGGANDLQAIAADVAVPAAQEFGQVFLNVLAKVALKEGAKFAVGTILCPGIGCMDSAYHLLKTTSQYCKGTYEAGKCNVVVKLMETCLALVQRAELLYHMVRVASRSISPPWGLVNSISSGSPHVRPMGVHRTCGEPDEIKENTHPDNTTALFRDRYQALEGGTYSARKEVFDGYERLKQEVINFARLGAKRIKEMVTEQVEKHKKK